MGLDQEKGTNSFFTRGLPFKVEKGQNEISREVYALQQEQLDGFSRKRTPKFSLHQSQNF